jgi:hypothetical protein
MARLVAEALSRAMQADPGPDCEMAEVSQEGLRQYLKPPLQPDSPELDADSQAAMRVMIRTYDPCAGCGTATLPLFVTFDVNAAGVASGASALVSVDAPPTG